MLIAKSALEWYWVVVVSLAGADSSLGEWWARYPLMPIARSETKGCFTILVGLVGIGIVSCE